MDAISSELLLQLTPDELAEVLEELTGIELNDQQVEGLRSLIATAGGLEEALELLDDLSSEAEAA